MTLRRNPRPGTECPDGLVGPDETLHDVLSDWMNSLHDYGESLHSTSDQELPEPIVRNHDVHDCVLRVEAFFPGQQLPLDIRPVWSDLVHTTRGNRPTVRPTSDCMEYVDVLVKWIEEQLAKLQTPAQKNRCGRKKADYETVQREAQLATDWVRARDSGIRKPDFAKQNGMDLKRFEMLLGRVRKQNARSHK